MSVYHGKIAISIALHLSFWGFLVYDEQEVIDMRKEEIWSVSIQRARAFFREQEDVTEEGMNDYVFGTCRISLTELKPKGMGVWAAKRIQVCMEGEDADVEAIYHRYFIQFLSTGG
jgi:hypothetical protein